MAIVTDLNQRERTRYADALINLADAARNLADSIRVGDDTTAVVHLIGVSMIGHTVNELAGVFQSAVSAEIPDHPPAADRNAVD